MKKRLLSILLVILLFASNFSMGGVTAKADSSEDPADISQLITEAEENSAKKEEALHEEEEPSDAPENEIAAPEEEEAAQEEEAASDEGEAAPEGILEERDSSGTCGDNITWT